MSPDPPSVSRAEVVADAGRTPGQALLGQMGGVSGLIYSALPVVILVPVSTAFGLLPALIAALSVAAGILVAARFAGRVSPAAALRRAAE